MPSWDSALVLNESRGHRSSSSARCSRSWHVTHHRHRRVCRRRRFGGDPNVIRERIGSAVKDLTFDRHHMLTPALSTQHFRDLMEKTAGPLIKLVERLSANDPAKLATFRKEIEATAAEHYDDNV
jgi:hypothetical protein